VNTKETNPYLRKLDQIQAAKKKWQESEWLLSFLRSEGCLEPKIPNDEELLEWVKNLH
jgi:hypothetical protein